MIVLDEGRVTQCGHPRKVLPLVEEQLQSTKDTEREESEGGTMGGAANKGDTGGRQLQVRKLVLCKLVLTNYKPFQPCTLAKRVMYSYNSKHFTCVHEAFYNAVIL